MKRDRGFSLHSFAACAVCGLLQWIRAARPGSEIDCSRCGNRIRWCKPATRHRTGLFALGALLLFIPAMMYPIASVKYMGNYNQFSMVDAVARLFELRHYLIGTFISIITILAPASQILGWCFLGVVNGGERWRVPARVAHRLVKIAAPWNMNEMFLLALIVGVVKFSDTISLQTGTGALAFALVVALSKAAAASFDAASDWDWRECEIKESSS